MKQGRLQSLVSITQILSSLAVVISIIILLVEFKRTSLVNEKSIENLFYSRMMALDKIVIENKDVTEIILKAHNHPDSLSGSELKRYLAYEHIFFDSWETLWVGFKDGLVENNTWNDWNAWFVQEAKKKPSIAISGNDDQFSRAFIIYLRNDIGLK